MPFPPSRVEEIFAGAAKEGRLAHAHLLTGAPPAELESLGRGLAANLLDADLEGHPDFSFFARNPNPAGFRLPRSGNWNIPFPASLTAPLSKWP